MLRRYVPSQPVIKRPVEREQRGNVYVTGCSSRCIEGTGASGQVRGRGTRATADKRMTKERRSHLTGQGTLAG